MLKSETERMLRRCIEETNAQFTEEQIQCLVAAFIKITERMIEEGFANNSGSSGSRGR
ncbi:MAG: hypothetical protein K2W95_15355 [Candidatus Obscuribacterales bacterium]|nr:hypothetical protein [Candidatus Obscuribacterales bacterium]